jgi:hypothetical protein
MANPFEMVGSAVMTAAICDARLQALLRIFFVGDAKKH